MSTNNNNSSIIQLETTPRVYYEHYMSPAPSYDLYPSLSRRLGNGYIHSPSRPTTSKMQQTDFIAFNSTSSIRRYNVNEDPLWRATTQQDNVNNTPPWDLYPALLRNVENFGTEQMRQRLHNIMENTITLH